MREMQALEKASMGEGEPSGKAKGGLARAAKLSAEGEI
jgi:hypothetical protein